MHYTCYIVLSDIVDMCFINLDSDYSDYGQKNMIMIPN